MSYNVRILPIAKAERREIFNYIAERSPQGTESWEAAYEEALTRLEANPHICPPALEQEKFDCDLRQLLFKTRHGHRYRLIFRVDENVVTIYRLRGPGQPPLTRVDVDG